MLHHIRHSGLSAKLSNITSAGLPAPNTINRRFIPSKEIQMCVNESHYGLIFDYSKSSFRPPANVKKKGREEGTKLSKN